MNKNSIEANKHTVLELIRSIEAGDMDALNKVVSDEVNWILPADPQTFRFAGSRDKQGFLKLVGILTATFQGSLKFDILGLIAEGDTVAVEAESHGESAFGNYHNRYHFLFQLLEGKVILAKEFNDTAYMEAFLDRVTKNTGELNTSKD
jgi:ketosteroid isomerase-like protein